MILSVNNVNKSFIDKTVAKDISFFLNEYDKAALVGINGCGKTTLIRMIMGELAPDSGLITIAKDTSIGYLPQNAILDTDTSIYDEVLRVKQDLLDEEAALRDMEAMMGELKGTELEDLMNHYHTAYDHYIRQGGDMLVSEVSGTLKGLGFTEDNFDQPVSTLSGGQKTRVALAKLLVGRPDIIILDEPTNHLDMSSIIWLENYLLNYKGTVLIVSHDRYFLDRIVNKVIELDRGIATTFTGNYTDYAAKKEILRVSELNAYLNQQRELKHQQEVIDKLRSFNREKQVKRADSRQKLLDRVEVLDKPTEVNDRMQIVLTPRVESGKDVLCVDSLSKSYGTNALFSNISFELKKGDHVAIIGDNGTGKTTILKILNKLVDADAGECRLGANVAIGYYDQEHHVLHDNKTIFEEISDDYPTLTNTEIRNTLAAFLFTSDDVFKKISTLSGGEKGRVSLAKLMLGEANLLVLDEPTNHLDITSKEILEGAINNYTGTVLYVSHDRYFINRTADRILELKGHRLTEYLGNYDYYLEKCEQTKDAASQDMTASTGNNRNEQAALDYKASKEEAARLKKIAKESARLEAEIEKLENRIAEIDNELNDPKNGTDTTKLIMLQKDKDTADEQLMELMEAWDKLQ